MCPKTCHAVVLMGSSGAIHSNKVIERRWGMRLRLGGIYGIEPLMIKTRDSVASNKAYSGRL